MKVSLYPRSAPVGRLAARRLMGLALFALALSSAAVAADPSLDALRAQDERLLRIAEPVMARNVQLCDRTMPDLGVALQSTDQYPAGASPPFAAPVAFAAVLPGSAAACTRSSRTL